MRRSISDWERSLALRILRTGATCRAVADEVGISAGAVSKIAKLYGVQVRRGARKGSSNAPHRKTPEVRQRAIEMVRAGKTLRAIGAALGVSHEAVSIWARAAGVVSIRSKHAWSVRKRRAIVMIKKGATDIEIIEMFGVCSATARGWRRAAGLDQVDGFTSAGKTPRIKSKGGRPLKNPKQISLAPVPPTVTTDAATEATKTPARADLEWLLDDIRRRQEMAGRVRELLLAND